ncbi:hypothetical protein [Nocardia australiensis]|uniref:hypothetical protein n=1 Tax=Nocardia australiensis TaxID=2887191 RepID=UPI001D13AC9F|nr:hypothetical protein [Nocardia australiensis]
MNTGERCHARSRSGGMAGTKDAQAAPLGGRDSGRPFDDVFNLVHHPDFLAVRSAIDTPA